jgi:hypothetical protein
MAFIRTIPPAEAEGPVREMYEQARGQLGYVPNWAQAFSLRPGVRDGWVALVKSIQSNLPVRSYELGHAGSRPRAAQLVLARWPTVACWPTRSSTRRR